MLRMGLVWLGALAAGLVMAGPASAVVIHKADGGFAGVMPRGGVNPGTIPDVQAPWSLRADPSATPSDGNLNFHGGVVLHDTRPYLIFWDPNATITPGTHSVLEAYFTDTAGAGLANTNVYAVGRQYTDANGFADAGQTFASGKQAVIDSQPFPTSSPAGCPTDGLSTCVTDAQLQTELTRLIAVDGLPAGNGPDAPVYLMITPSDVNVCLDGSTCADSAFCAYHSNFTDSIGGSPDVIYAAIPLLNANKACQGDNTGPVQAPNGMQPDGTVPDVAVDNMSHEYNEAITDPDGDGWYSSSGNEQADNCQTWGPSNDPGAGMNPQAYAPTLGGAAADGSLFDQSIARGSFYTQSEWSNAQSDCFLQVTGPPPAASFTAAGSTGDTVTFDPSASTSAAGFSSTTWDLGDGTTAFAASGPTPISHTYGAAGPAQVTLTVVDLTGNLATQTQTVDVSPSQPPPSPPPPPAKPVAAFASSPRHPASGLPVHFDATHSAEAAAAIVTYAWSFGDGGRGAGARSSHTYHHAGRYTVQLTVTDANGQRGSTARVLNVVRPEKIVKLILGRAGRDVRLTIKLSGPGTLQVGSHRRKIRRARTLNLRLGLSRTQRRALIREKRLVYSVKVVFNPQAGRRVRTTARIKL
jgi:hypothetical protein